MKDDLARATQSILDNLLALQIALKKAEFWSRRDLTLVQIQQLCDELDEKYQELKNEPT